MGKYPSMSDFQWAYTLYPDVEYSHPLEEGPLPSRGGWLIPLPNGSRRSVNTYYSTRTRQQPGYKDMPTKRRQPTHGGYPPSTYRLWLTISLKAFILLFHSLSSLYVNNCKRVISYGVQKWTQVAVTPIFICLILMLLLLLDSHSLWVVTLSIPWNRCHSLPVFCTTGLILMFGLWGVGTPPQAISIAERNLLKLQA